MNKGSVSRTVAAAATAGSLLWAGCNGTVSNDESAPAQVRQPMRKNPSDLPRLATGRFHSLALKPDGRVWAWGLNTDRQLGDGTNTNSAQPVAVQGLPTGTFVTVAAGLYHSMALHGDGSLWAWGRNDWGQLGSTVGNGPMQVVFPTLNNQTVKVAAMDAGAGFSVALDTDGRVWAWGTNGDCQLGNGGVAGSAVPAQVTKDDSQPLTGVVAIAAGLHSVLAVREDGTVWAWGDNTNGLLGIGDGVNTDRCRAVSIPLALGGSTAVPVDVAMGSDHSLLLLSDTTLMAWGNNSYGQLGTGSYPDGSPSPASAATAIPVPNFTGVTQISAGVGQSLAVVSQPNVSQRKWFAWGFHNYGQLCSGSGGGYSMSMSKVPVTASVVVDMRYVGAGEYFSIGMAADGSLWSCGDDGYGVLGYNPWANYTQTLAQVPSFP